MLWSRHSQTLKEPRSNHMTIVDGDLLVHVGGSSNHARKFESWRVSKADSNQFDIDQSTSRLENWTDFPYAFFVEYNNYVK